VGRSPARRIRKGRAATSMEKKEQPHTTVNRSVQTSGF